MTTGVPGAALRGLLGVAALVLLLSVVAVAPQGRAPLTSLLVGAALVGWVVVSPGSPAPTALVLLALVVVLDAGPAGGPLLAVQAAAVSAVHLLAGLCALAPAHARWQPAALRAVARRWLLTQAVCLPVVLLAGAQVPLGPTAGLDVAAGVLALPLVVGLLWITRAPRTGRRPND